MKLSAQYFEVPLFLHTSIFDCVQLCTGVLQSLTLVAKMLITNDVSWDLLYAILDKPIKTGIMPVC